ncbi:TPA: asparagine synthetase B [Candidatus Latescibacteria bacterium]|nr:asparagine synthetase B [Candidatus Latescibacterota bacterium]
MTGRFFKLLTALVVYAAPVQAQKILIPMDLEQSDHLKAYGLAYTVLERGYDVEWLLNYRGGAFLSEASDFLLREARLRNIRFSTVSNARVGAIYGEIEDTNADRVKLEKAPKIAVYTPPNKQPWDDAVTLALTYAEIPYATLWDKDILTGKLTEYDWVHLHHEDFTGQYGKFYRSHGRELWYRQQQRSYEQMARGLGFTKVSTQKGAVVQAFADYVRDGGFLFAMCSATDTFDIALAAWGQDIVDTVYDGDPTGSGVQDKLRFGNTFAFENFELVTDPMEYEYSSIDLAPKDERGLKGPDADAFTLFEFSAKYDPVPTMLTQNHVPIVRGFLGQTTAFRRSQIKPSVTILGEVTGTDTVKYIHGNVGRGTFTFYAGHDPEDYRHLVGDPPTQLALHKNSPGYRLILNNILFPAAKKQKRKT